MESPESDGYIPTFYIGHHDSRDRQVTQELLQQAIDSNYDMLTTPLTTPHFHDRVLSLVRNHLEDVEKYPSKSLPVPTVPSLSPADTPLGPGEIVSQLLAVVSPWIDLCSPDPVVYDISRQVLGLEVAYASFCGIGNIILPAPRLHHGRLHGDGVVRYAYAVQEALCVGQYIQLSVSLPMTDIVTGKEDGSTGNLGARARGKYVGLIEHESQESLGEHSQWQGEAVRADSRSSGKTSAYDSFGTWDAWNVIRTICNYNSRLFVALSIPAQLPPLSVQSRWHSEPLRILLMDKTTFSINANGFARLSPYHQSLLTQYMRIRQPPWLLLSDVGPIPGSEAPHLSSSGADSTTIGSSMAPDSVLDAPLPTPAEASHFPQKENQYAEVVTPYLTHLRYLQHNQPPRSILEKFGSGYQDYLQAPLQPLTDNLESITYEVFEKDPMKYNQYLAAIRHALVDWRNEKKPASGPEGRIVVAVVGAGRGPLVTRALRASDSMGIPIEIWAVEKNPNAFVLLQRHNSETWNNRVNLVQSDMRSWKGPSSHTVATPHTPPSSTSSNTNAWPIQDPTTSSSHILQQRPNSSQPQPPPQSHHPIDILISELLGSFADNELSPECLDGMLPLLNPTHGISIPCSYTAYLTPIAAPKLHADIVSRAGTDPEASNTPYVVMLHAIDYLSTKSSSSSASKGGSTHHLNGDKEAKAEGVVQAVPNILPAWSFHHSPPSPTTNTDPNTNTSTENRHNTRHARLSFSLRDRATCHGLAGYFEAVLYPGVELSTNPLTMEDKSPLMMSWFPIYFPLKTPIYTPDASTLVVNISRQTDNRKVWYEWVVEAFSNLLPTSSSAGKVRLGISEVGNSRKGGCLM